MRANNTNFGHDEETGKPLEKFTKGEAKIREERLCDTFRELDNTLKYKLLEYMTGFSN